MASASSNSNHQHQDAAQRQHQELIKLLTQHFYLQFYQSNTNLDDNSTSASNLGSSNDARGQELINGLANDHFQHHQASSAAILANYQQQLTQFSKNSGEYSLLGSGTEIPDGFNLVAGSSTNQLQRTNSSRSQATTKCTNSNLFNASPAESLIDFTLRNRGLNSYSLINDINILEALNLNLTNNQLVHSLQRQHQQSMLQLGNNGRQRCEVRKETDGYTQESRRNSNDTINNLNNYEDNHSSDGKTMLKFSINTILGRGSPDKTVSTATSHQAANMGTSINSPSLSKMRRTSDDRLFTIDSMPNQTCSERRTDLTKPGELDEDDCDPLIEDDSSNESVSIDNQAMPLPQQTSSATSVLYNPNHQHFLQNHRSVSNLATNVAQPMHLTSVSAHQHQQSNHHHQQHAPLAFLANSSAFPWTVAARGKPRRGMMRRAVFSDSQRVGLEKRFQLQKYISKPDRKKLAEKLGLRDSQVKIWFQNRRMKWRNSKERELLSAGGSREQTLPTRNNPNPDLSDVGETIKRVNTDIGSNNDSVVNS